MKRSSGETILKIIIAITFFTSLLIFMSWCSSGTEASVRLYEQKLNQEIMIEQLVQRMK